ncbi:SRPBCC domain-containing protein [Fodinicola feengrottensis]|uniref:SRPBCC domain-containing protein n=1 Tax=Fodinicola feengrottensis TaxID=435914 RepID=A0ABN2G5H8_9ACTN
MGREFETVSEQEVAPTPEQIWAAIATGPGINSWFMGRTDVLAGAGGVIRTAFGAYAPESTVTGWEPNQRLAHRTETAQDGRFVAYEFLLEGREQGSTVVRMVASGFLPGDDWADEYEAMTRGLRLFFRTLVEYVTHFAGRAAIPVTAFGPPVENWDAVWPMLGQALGLDRAAVSGDQVRVPVPDHGLVDGVVYFVNPDTVGIRTDDALYRFMRGFRGPLVAAHHVFADIDPMRAEQAWRTWLTEVVS